MRTGKLIKLVTFRSIVFCDTHIQVVLWSVNPYTQLSNIFLKIFNHLIQKASFYLAKFGATFRFIIYNDTFIINGYELVRVQ